MCVGAEELVQTQFETKDAEQHVAVGEEKKNNGIPFWGRYHFGVGAPPILEPILAGIGTFTRGYGILTHGHAETKEANSRERRRNRRVIWARVKLNQESDRPG